MKVRIPKIRWLGRWISSHRLMVICLAVSTLIHFLILFSVTPIWPFKKRIHPRKVRTVSLKIRPRPAPPAISRPRKKPPEEPPPIPKKPIYTEKELEEKLERVRPKRKIRPTDRVEQVIKKKREETKAWVDEKVRKVEDETRKIESGEVGYSRVIDLRGSSSYQVSRLLEDFGMEIKFGNRPVSDMDIKFTTEWLYRPEQIRDYLYRHAGLGTRKIVSSLDPSAGIVSLRESGGEKSRTFIMPTVKAIAAIVVAEEEFFSRSKADPEELEKLVFTPRWSFRGASFEVTVVEKKTDRKNATPSPAPGGGKSADAESGVAPSPVSPGSGTTAPPSGGNNKPKVQ